MTKDDAEAKLITSRLEQRDKFCPLIKDLCREDCAAYYEGRLFESTFSDVSKWQISPTTCLSPTITGVMRT